MFHIVFLDPPDEAYLAAEVEAAELIRSRMPDVVFTPWQGQTMRAYPDEQSRDLAERPRGSIKAHYSAFVIEVSKSNDSV
jgi:hypothetical protein